MGGFVTHTGADGLTLGGGIGWLTSTAGLACDNLLTVGIVTADSCILRASKDHYPTFFGRSVAVVTSLTFALHPVGERGGLDEPRSAHVGARSGGTRCVGRSACMGKARVYLPTGPATVVHGLAGASADACCFCGGITACSYGTTSKPLTSGLAHHKRAARDVTRRGIV
jgi:hypothetical protein